MVGLLNVRGRMVVAVDLGAWLASGSSADPDSSVLLVADGERLLGLVVNAVEDVRMLESGEPVDVSGEAERSSSPVVLLIDTRTLISQILLEEKG